MGAQNGFVGYFWLKRISMGDLAQATPRSEPISKNIFRKNKELKIPLAILRLATA